jgi:hypothetical protein
MILSRLIAIVCQNCTIQSAAILTLAWDSDKIFWAYVGIGTWYFQALSRMYAKNKTVQIEIRLSDNGGNPWRRENRSIFFSGQKSIMPIVKIVFPQSIYLFHGTIPNNAGGGRNYFCNRRHPSPKLVQIVDSTLMYCNSTNWSLVQPLSQLTLFAIFNPHPPLLGCRGEKNCFWVFSILMLGKKAICPDGLFVPAVFQESNFYLNSLK